MYTVNKFPLTRLLSRVYSQQVLSSPAKTKFTFPCLRPQVFLDKFTFSSVSQVHRMFISRQDRPFVCQNHKRFSCPLVKFSLSVVETRTNIPCPKPGTTIALEQDSFARKNYVQGLMVAFFAVVRIENNTSKF